MAQQGARFFPFLLRAALSEVAFFFVYAFCAPLSCIVRYYLAMLIPPFVHYYHVAQPRSLTRSFFTGGGWGYSFERFTRSPSWGGCRGTTLMGLRMEEKMAKTMTTTRGRTDFLSRCGVEWSGVVWDCVLLLLLALTFFFFFAGWSCCVLQRLNAFAISF